MAGGLSGDTMEYHEFGLFCFVVGIMFTIIIQQMGG
jgi:hypothetical protein